MVKSRSGRVACRSFPRNVLLSVGIAGLGLVSAACASTPAALTTPSTGPATSDTTTTLPATRSTPATTPVVGATAQVTLVVPTGNGGGTLATPRTLTVPTGWSAEVWARVPEARFEAWTPEGDLLVSVPGAGEIVELVPRTDPAAPPAQHVLLSGLAQPQGMAFAKVDGQETLYVGESDQIDRYPWHAGDVTGTRTVIAAGLPDLDPSGDDDHRPKDMAVGTNGTVYFDVGSSSNANPDDRTSSPARAVIMAVEPDGTKLHVVATGVRNGEGLSIAPDGTLWSAVNERDNVTFPLSTSRTGG